MDGRTIEAAAGSREERVAAGLELLPKRPRLKPWYRLAEVDGAFVFEYGQSVLRFEGAAAKRLLPAVLPLLDGKRTLDEIGALLGAPVAPAAANALVLLARHQLLEEGSELATDLPTGWTETAEFLAATSGQVLTAGTALNRVRDAQVAVLGTSPLAAEFARILGGSGVPGIEHVTWAEAEKASDDVELLVAAPAPEELVRLPHLNRTALAAGIEWLQLLPYDGRFAAVGPLYVPGETCCYECYRLRRAANIGYPAEYWALERVPLRGPTAPSLTAVIAGVGATLALGWLTRRDAELPGVLTALEYEQVLRLSAHVVYRAPRCAACSHGARTAPPRPWPEA